MCITQKSLFFTLTMSNLRRKLEQFLFNGIKKNKILMDKLKQRSKTLTPCNYKALLK
jgi:hypothetical protein